MFSTLSHIFISLHCNHCWSFKHALNIIPSKNLTYFNKTPFIPSHFNTRHLFSRSLIPCTLTLFAQNSATLSPLSTSILKKAGVGGCSVAKPLACKFEAKTAHSPNGADGICATEEGRRRRPRPAWRKQRRLPARALRRRRSPKAKGAKDPRAEGQTGPDQVLVLNKL